MQKTIQLCLLLLVGLLVLPSFTGSEGDKPVFPKKVNGIIQKKCYGCHSNDAKFDKPKNALNWDNLNGLEKAEKLEKMKGILKVAEKGSMPPARFLESHPEDKLTEKETAALKKWASKSVKKLSK